MLPHENVILFKTRMKKLFFILFILFSLRGSSQILSVEISGIRNNKGVLQLLVYRDKDTFAAETPYRLYNFPKTGMLNEKITLTIDNLPPGEYGITLVDDENENGKIDYRFFVPKEGFGFSNYYFEGNRKPDFESFSFQLSGEKKTVKIQVQYF